MPLIFENQVKKALLTVKPVLLVTGEKQFWRDRDSDEIVEVRV